jgi:chromosome segregation protein
MRLSTIKLSGFKSFVDPTTLHLPTNMTGVVGPNGCGKSNIIDAIRWVMGESAASRLRGDSLTDVIFSGSSARKPVSQAMVELIFDNSDHTITGEYAAFNEISVKRLVSRDGQSSYYLNGTKCRRRDITDLFLGTGLGPRSYSIIEQGMISQIIEAKPEELRVYLEEAAGISKYKERRKETETRIRHTRENLDRLNDLREEVGKQLEHLARQAKQAEQYTAIQAERRIKDVEWKALEFRALDGKLQRLREKLAQEETRLEQLIAEQREAERELETGRERRETASDALNAAQAAVYRVGATWPGSNSRSPTSANCRPACSVPATKRWRPCPNSARTSPTTSRSWMPCVKRWLMPSRDWNCCRKATSRARTRCAMPSCNWPTGSSAGTRMAASRPRPRVPATWNAPASSTSIDRCWMPTVAANS